MSDINIELNELQNSNHDDNNNNVLKYKENKSNYINKCLLLFVWMKAHYIFIFRYDYLRLAFAAISGRIMKIFGTLCGALVVTPLYKLLSESHYSGTNIVYDRLSPFLRHWFEILKKQKYTSFNIVSMIENERRGCVWSELLFTILQIVLFKVSILLLLLTIAGVFVNAIPRQFYAQLKMLIRGLHIAYVDATAETLIHVLPNKEQVKYAGRDVFDEDDKEIASNYLVFRGNHHSGCWRVVITEAIDIFFSFIGGLIMLYLLSFTIVLGLALINVIDRDDFSSYFPFYLITIARFTKFICNFATTENLINNADARERQHEIYFLQRLQVIKSVFNDNGSKAVEAIQGSQDQCMRDILSFIGKPCLIHEEYLSFDGPGLCMFEFLVTNKYNANDYRMIIDDGVCSCKQDMLTRTEDGDYPPPFESDDSLNELKLFTAQLLWHTFDVTKHSRCKLSEKHNASNCVHNIGALNFD